MTSRREQSQEAQRALNAAGVTEVDASPGATSRYATDASIYRIPPVAVTWPRHTDDIEAALAVAREFDVGITVRGAGTSIAGNAIGEGIVVDVSRYLNQVLDFDAEQGTATVQPGVVHRTLQQLVAPAGWRLGPDPSTHTRCTIGGMIGNNACGARALGYGRTADITEALTVLLSDGRSVTIGHDADNPTATDLRQQLQELVSRNLAHVRQTYGKFSRQVSGYSLEHLLPENSCDLARFLVGSEGTLGVITGATVKLARTPAATGLLAIGFRDSVQAAAAVPLIVEHQPVACEGMDSRLVDLYAEQYRGSTVPDLPAGDAWLFVEFTGETPSHCYDKAQRLSRELGDTPHRFTASTTEQHALWTLREAGAGIAGRGSAGRPAYAGWEDSAVPPQALANYLRELEALIAEHDYIAVPYGHFGEGCVHLRVTFDFGSARAVQRYDVFMNEAASLVAKHGGSLSGEHGDGRARSSLLHHMYSQRDLQLFGAVKEIFDPAGLLNPGVLVAADHTAAQVRDPSPAVWLPTPRRRFETAGGVTAAAHQCTGVGSCRIAPLHPDSAMCPSYQASLSEEHTTRGRARILQDATEGHLGRAALASDEVEQALSLCLSCKACARDCPAGVDMAALKSEALWQRYRGSVRPPAHYTLGRLADIIRLLRSAPAGDQVLSGVSSLLRTPLGMRLAAPFLRLGGVHPKRVIPPLAAQSARAHAAELGLTSGARAVHGDGNDVVLFLDTFTDNFAPSSAFHAASALRRAGYRVHIVPRQGCCGLPLISTGQLDAASDRLTKLTAQLSPYVAAGARVVGTEPSCLAALHDEATELVADSALDAARAVAESTTTLAALLLPRAEFFTRLDGVTVVAQPHCHQRSAFGWRADQHLLESLGATVIAVPGCCGMAGNFGAQSQHFDFSVRVAGTNLIPALHAHPEAVVLADGFSCQTQLAQVASHRQVTHLASLIQRAHR